MNVDFIPYRKDKIRTVRKIIPTVRNPTHNLAVPLHAMEALGGEEV
jgi:hypothetical protein